MEGLLRRIDMAMKTHQNLHFESRLHGLEGKRPNRGNVGFSKQVLYIRS